MRILIILLALTACQRNPFNTEKYISVYNTCVKGFQDSLMMRVDDNDIRYCNYLAEDAAKREEIKNGKEE